MSGHIQFVKAFAGVSASERPFVERVRIHILPMEPTGFETLAGAELTVGGPDLVPLYFETLEAHRLSRGSTYIPQLVDHEGAALGVLDHYEMDDGGLWSVMDLWAEGVEARKGRDFGSAFWQFSDPGADGRPRAATVHEVSFTHSPQFNRAQTPVESLDTEESPQVAATLSASAPPSPRGNMTPEEMAKLLLGSEEFKTGIAEMVATAVTEALAASEVAAMEAADADAAEDEEAKVAAAADADAGTDVEKDEKEDEPAEKVAASSSMLALITAINAKVDRNTALFEVAASLRGRTIIPPAIGGPTPGADFITARLNDGINLTDALAENKALQGGQA